MHLNELDPLEDCYIMGSSFCKVALPNRCTYTQRRTRTRWTSQCLCMQTQSDVPQWRKYAVVITACLGLFFLNPHRKSHVFHPLHLNYSASMPFLFLVLLVVFAWLQKNPENNISRWLHALNKVYILSAHLTAVFISSALSCGSGVADTRNDVWFSWAKRCNWAIIECNMFDVPWAHRVHVVCSLHGIVQTARSKR